MNADEFLKRLKALRSPTVAKSYNHLGSDDSDAILGVRMGQVFALAKEFIGIPLSEIEKLFESPLHEARVGTVSIMDFQARNKKTTEQRRKELFDLYIRRHDRIYTRDLVDRRAQRSESHAPKTHWTVHPRTPTETIAWTACLYIP